MIREALHPYEGLLIATKAGFERPGPDEWTPNGSPGPWTVIRVIFSRFYLNEPIKVRLSFTTHPFKAPKRTF